MAESQYEMRSYKETRKVILLGAVGAGKTTLFRIFAGLPTSKSNSTQGLRKANKMKDFNHHKVTLWLWDTAGMERMRSLTNSYYRDCHAAILVMDATNRESLNDLNTIWLEAVRARENPESSTQLFLVVTRQDKVEKAARDGCIFSDYVSEDDVRRFVHETGSVFSGVYHMRSTDKAEIDNMFDDIASKVKRGGNSNQEDDDSNSTENKKIHLHLGYPEKIKQFFSKCCHVT